MSAARIEKGCMEFHNNRSEGRWVGGMRVSYAGARPGAGFFDGFVGATACGAEEAGVARFEAGGWA